MNKRHIKKLLTIFENRGSFKDLEEKQKVEYILSVIVGELEKCLLLLLMFSILEWGMEFLLSIFVVSVTRSFAGGLHQKTNIKCLMHSFIFFMFIWYIEKIETIKAYICIFYGTLFMLYIIFAPQVSNKRGFISRKRRLKMKSKSLMGLSITYIVVLLYPSASSVVSATILAVSFDFILLIIKKEVCSNVRED